MKVCLVEPEMPMPGYTYVPTALLQLATALDRAGHKVAVSKTGDVECDVLCVSATMPQYYAALNIARRSKAGTKVLGGAYMTSAPGEAMSRLFDYGISGAGELALISLLDGVDPHRIEGLSYWDEGPVLAKRVPRIQGLVEPHYHWIEVGERVNFCTEQQDGLIEGTWYRPSRFQVYKNIRNTRRKSIRAIREEIEELQSYGVLEVVVMDDPFGVDKRDFVVWSKNPGILDELDTFSRWYCRVRPDIVTGNELSMYLEGRNCACEIDVLTGSERLLEEHAPWSMDDTDEAIYRLGRILPTTLHVTIGLPGETVVSLRETRAWLRMIDLPTKVSTFVPYPGMVEYEEIDRYAMFGFEVTGCNCLDFSIDDRGPIDCVPWRSEVIEMGDFITLRNEMIEEFNKE